MNELAIDDRLSSLSVSTALDVAAASDEELTVTGYCNRLLQWLLTGRKPPPRTYRVAILRLGAMSTGQLQFPSTDIHARTALPLAACKTERKERKKEKR